MKLTDKLRIALDGGIDYKYILQKGDKLIFDISSPLRINQWAGTTVYEAITTMGNSRGKLLRVERKECKENEIYG